MEEGKKDLNDVIFLTFVARVGQAQIVIISPEIIVILCGAWQKQDESTWPV
jgi:hypothetical protein